MSPRSKPRRKAHTKIRPEQKTGEKPKLNRHWRRLFLDTLADTSNVTAAARMAGINPARAYKVRRSEAEFARQWTAALIEGYENLELETLNRLRHGTDSAGPRFDVGAALRLLTLHRASIVRERARDDDADEEAVLADLNARLEAMRIADEALENLRPKRSAGADSERP
ncbi:hypothetical protein [Croceibacterium aestuarii]|uniref:hypothetical protein n=1 Tax=Croceibacterium aestuarii TaxID=3064139 RepID=UPI00272EADB1|nr:hypothetical protein [Croceibacterium sp. D39]